MHQEIQKKCAEVSISHKMFAPLQHLTKYGCTYSEARVRYVKSYPVNGLCHSSLTLTGHPQLDVGVFSSPSRLKYSPGVILFVLHDKIARPYLAGNYLVYILYFFWPTQWSIKL